MSSAVQCACHTKRDMQLLVYFCNISLVFANSQAILDHLNSNTLNIDEKINSAFLALDLVQEAQRNSTKRQKIFCQAKLLEGKLYSDLLLNKVNAKNCFREVIDTALTLQYSCQYNCTS